MEKDLKLYEAEKLFLNLFSDHASLRRSKDAKTYIDNLREVNEILTAAKYIYNINSKECNEKIKKIPSNIVSKFHKIKERELFNNIKTDDFKTNL